MMVNNEIGTVQPIKELTSICHDKGVLIHTDAVQAVGHMAINVHDLDVDMLSASGHKFNGPKGVGFLYIKKGTVVDPLINGGSQEGGLRAGTENYIGVYAMAIALKNNTMNLTNNMQHILQLEDRLFKNLDKQQINYVRNGNQPLIPGLISVSFPGCEGEVIRNRLNALGMYVSTGSACTSSHTEISHVLSSLKIPRAQAIGTIRISLSKSNTINEIDLLTDNLSSIIRDVQTSCHTDKPQ